MPRHPGIEGWPAASTVGDLLRRAGLVKRRPRLRTPLHPGVVPIATTAPNELWTRDFKGHFKTQDGVHCYPLTPVDQHTCFLLAVQWLSQLNVWWLRLGIRHQRIHPASPQENGAHERMHKTLEAEATRLPKGSCWAQQRAFAAFRTEYNHERPHSALDGATPASRYQPSPRPYPTRLPLFAYPGHFVVKMVARAGAIRLRSRLLFIAHAFTHEYIGLEEIDDGLWSIHVGPMQLARVSERDFILSG